MADFFSLGSNNNTSNNATLSATATRQQQHQRQQEEGEGGGENLRGGNNNNINLEQHPWNSGSAGGSGAAPSGSSGGVLLYRNEEIYQKGFEIWQQYVQVHHHHHHHNQHQIPYLYPMQQPQLGGGGGGGGGGGDSSLSSSGGGVRIGGVNCQDCGNQAKKDCSYLRCRTCCKSRGFDCPTHVKSTWVPAAKRRERQQLLASSSPTGMQQRLDQHRGDGGRGTSGTDPQGLQKRQRDIRRGNTSTNFRNSTSPPAAAGLEVGTHFPAEVNSPAVFRCVRVSAMEDPDEQLAYQTAVSIGGHLFKGILYDQGPASSSAAAAAPHHHAHHRYGSGASGAAGGGGHVHHAIQEHNLLASNPTSTAALMSTIDHAAAASTAPSAGAGGGSNTIMDPAAAMYAAPINAFLAGTQFFPPPPRS